MTDLIFDPEKHEYQLNGIIIPSVTQILEDVGISDFSGIPFDNLEYARIRGTLVHKATALDDEGDLDEDSLDPVIIPYVMGWRKFKEEFAFVPIQIERMIYHPTYGYCGTLDRTGNIEEDYEKEILLDIKSGTVYIESVGPQTAAYEEALRHEIGGKKRRRFAVKLMDTGEFKLIPCTNTLDFEVFKNAVSVVNWVNRKHRRF
jgi:hypothetical protein